MGSKRLHEVSKRQALREQRKKKQRQQRLLIIGGVIALVVIFVVLAILPSLAPVGDFIIPADNPRPNANLNSMGDPNAPVKMVAYSDFQCPYCKIYSDETEQQIVDTYVKTGKVYYTYIPYGPTGLYIGPESEAAAQAAYCAGDQGKFWEFHDILFANHTGENVGDFTDKRLSAFAKAIKLNTGEFQACLQNDKFGEKLKEGITQGQQAGIEGTPSFIINGKIVLGAQSFEAFKTEIEAALSAAGAQ